MEAFSDAQNKSRPQYDVGLSREIVDDPSSLDWDWELCAHTDGPGATHSNPSIRAGTEVDLNEAIGPCDPNGSASSELVETLSGILLDKEQRKTLCDLTGDDAQATIDYLYSILLRPTLPETWLRRHSLIALYKLCKRTQLYPQCYILKDLTVSSTCEAFGGFSDIRKGKFGEKELCLKIVRLNKSNMDVMLKRYAKEAILWGQLSHPNIIPFYGIYYLNSVRHQLCLVSPWMQYGDIVGYLKMNLLVPRAPFMYDIAAGLGYLHEQGLIHSDLKGSNVLVNDQQEACLTDFGMSHIRTDRTLMHAMTTTTVHGFTQRWASPELLDDDARPTMASDIWALACVFYEILTGKLPFDHLMTDLQIVKALLKGEVPARLHSIPNGEEVLWRLIACCWAQEPSQRSTCRDILSQLRSASIFRPRDHSVQCAAEHESRCFRDEMLMNRGDYVDIDVVKHILGVVRNFGLNSSDSSDTGNSVSAMFPNQNYVSIDENNYSTWSYDASDVTPWLYEPFSLASSSSTSIVNASTEDSILSPPPSLAEFGNVFDFDFSASLPNEVQVSAQQQPPFPGQSSHHSNRHNSPTPSCPSPAYSSASMEGSREPSPNQSDGGRDNPRRRYPCLVLGCTRRFTSQYTLKVHMEAHKPKPRVTFPCTLGCSEKFSRQHDRLRHEVAKHGKVCEFSCPNCGRFFSTNKTLEKHKCPVAS